MSNILAASNLFDQSINDYVEQRRIEQINRQNNKWESRAFAALGMLTTMTAATAMSMFAGSAFEALPGDASIAMIAAPVAVGVAVYIAHQAAPFMDELKDKLKGMAASVPNIGTGIANAFSRFSQSTGGLGDKLGLSDAAKALKADSKYIKSIIGVDSLSNVKRVANYFYGSQNANAIVHDAKWLRDGIDQAVKDKLKAKDHSPLSYRDIETGILKLMEKANVLRDGIEDARGHIDVIENVRLMIGKPNGSNMDLPKGDLNQILDDHVIKKLKGRDAEKDSELGL